MTQEKLKAQEALGGTLFPVHDANVLLSEGISLLDYFAAHAPIEPPSWFEATILPRPSEHSRNDLLDRIADAYVTAEGEWTTEVRPARDPKTGIFFTPTKEQVAMARIYWEKQSCAVKKIGQWRKDHANARHVQWPYAWARLQIAERARVHAQIEKEVSAQTKEATHDGN